MFFNSIEFAFFLPIVFILYWFVFNNNLRHQNILLLISSYFFYGCWDYRFLALIIFSSFIDFFVGIRLLNTKDKKKRKLLLLLSIVVNLGFLGFFKYFNFFADSFADVFTLFGNHIEPTRLNIILPVGISFYTFQTLSYSIDVYNKKLQPTRDIIAFFSFVSFFPQLVAGPIERATNLLPQFYKRRNFEYAKAVDGMRQILWGLFKKIVIADNCASYADRIFDNSFDYSGSTLLLGAIFFTFQIYCDFSGYSDIAIGTSRLFGFNLRRNFNSPYFSRDIAEFWRRWHISLSTWFRDYLYIPLGGSKCGLLMKIRNVFIIFIVSGFWHGANWTFILWGLVNACLFLPVLLLKRNRINTNIVAEGKNIPSVYEIFQMIKTFFITVLVWVFFRATSVNDAFVFMNRIFSKSLFSSIDIHEIKIYILLFILSIFILVEWFQREKEHPLQICDLELNIFIRSGIYYTLILSIFFLGVSSQSFIYFQF